MEDIRLLSIRETDAFAEQDLLRKLRANLRITSRDMDGILLQCLRSAVEDSEMFIGSVIVSSKYTYTDRITHSIASHLLHVRLLGPVSPQESPKVTLAGEDITYTLNGRDLSVEIPDGADGVLTIAWRAGMSVIPDNIVHAILLKAAYLFDHPTETVKERVTTADKLLKPFKPYRHD